MPKTNRGTSQICITFNIKDLPLAEHLKAIIGHGNIRIKAEENACVLTITNKDGYLYIINILNGYFRTPKVHKFYQLIDFLNTKYSLTLPKLDRDTSPLDYNSWLAGFIDADGGFKIRNNQKTLTTKRRIACSLVIEQRMLDPVTGESYNDILLKIANLFQINLLIKNQKTTERNYFNITASSTNSITIIKIYLDMYPLYSSKYLDYQNWRQVVNLILENNHYEVDNTIIQNLKDTMNNKRTYFNWEHLNKLGTPKS